MQAYGGNSDLQMAIAIRVVCSYVTYHYCALLLLLPFSFCKNKTNEVQIDEMVCL